MHLDMCVEGRRSGTLQPGWRKQYGAHVGGSSGGHILPNFQSFSPKNNSLEIFIEK